MIRKLLSSAALLLLVIVQALAVNCDLRCSLMGASTDCHTLHTDSKMPHCHGMSMERDKQISLTASRSCAPTGCSTQLTALTKSTDQKDAGSGNLLVLTAVWLDDPLENDLSNGPTTFRLLSRTSDSRPLAQRPGSSLRI